VFDPTLAPEGKHVMSMFTQWVPCDWSEDPHTDELDAYADRVIAQMELVAPGFTNSILHRQVIGPYEMEHTYGLIGGNIFHGELSPAQLFHMRPAPGYADYRTPIRDLYQASSATHGGGGVTGIPALKVVEQITHDRSRRVRPRMPRARGRSQPR
jgi:phytoene dehydrogenase-like protein